MRTSFPTPDMASPAHWRHGKYYVEVTFHGLIHSWLVSHALGVLLDYQRAGEDFPTEADFALDLFADVTSSGSWWCEWGPKCDTNANSFTPEHAEKMSESAAFALEVFDPSYLERAARGGRKSRRGPTFTQRDLARFDGLSVTDAAAAIGCSERTVKRLRRARRDSLARMGEADRVLVGVNR